MAVLPLPSCSGGFIGSMAVSDEFVPHAMLVMLTVEPVSCIVLYDSVPSADSVVFVHENGPGITHPLCMCWLKTPKSCASASNAAMIRIAHPYVFRCKAKCWGCGGCGVCGSAGCGRYAIANTFICRCKT